MKNYLKHYKIRIDALSPIHIGSGVKIGKKEYIYIPRNHQVIIPDIEKMFLSMQKKGLTRDFTDFMMDSRQGGMTLSQWLRQHQFTEKDYESWKLYQMDAGEAFILQTARPKEIDTFVKDAYGMPYVPGSSIKGMFRTAIIAWELHKKPEKYSSIRQEINQEIKRASTERVGRTQFLARQTDRLEQMVLYTLNRDEKKPNNAVNDCLSGLHVGDSEPIELSRLTLSQKIDYTLDGVPRALPLLRETLIPGTVINCELSIDTTLCPYDMEDISEALKYFQDVCNRYFYSRFKREVNEKDAVWLGGGCGFLSKTIIYSLCGDEAVKVTDNIFKITLGDKIYKEHKHEKDLRLGLAPHVCKCTKYKGELYDMGLGRIQFSADA